MSDHVRDIAPAEQGRWEQMGIRPLNLSVWEQPATPLLHYALRGLSASNERCGGITSEVAQADGVILVPSRAPVDVEEAGVFGLLAQSWSAGRIAFAAGCDDRTIQPTAADAGVWPDTDGVRVSWQVLREIASLRSQ